MDSSEVLQEMKKSESEALDEAIEGDEPLEEVELEFIDVDDESVGLKEKKNLLLSIIWAFLYFVIIMSLCILLANFGFQRTVVEGASMQPTLSSGDNVLVNKFSYYFAEPERYDIIVFAYDKGNNVYYIKRIIGLPGETVQIIGGYVYINGEILEDDVYGLEPIISAGIAAQPITLGDGEYFVLGDNRNESSDSRVADVGIVYRNQIEGKAWLRIWPLESIGLLNSTVALDTEEEV